MSNHKPATALPGIFTPSSAIQIAIADHRAGPLTDWPFVDALHKAKARCDAYPRLVARLKAIGADTTAKHADANTALLRELGEEA